MYPWGKYSESGAARVAEGKRGEFMSGSATMYESFGTYAPPQPAASSGDMMQQAWEMFNAHGISLCVIAGLIVVLICRIVMKRRTMARKGMAAQMQSGPKKVVTFEEDVLVEKKEFVGKGGMMSEKIVAVEKKVQVGEGMGMFARKCHEMWALMHSCICYAKTWFHHLMHYLLTPFIMIIHLIKGLKSNGMAGCKAIIDEKQLEIANMKLDKLFQSDDVAGSYRDFQQFASGLVLPVVQQSHASGVDKKTSMQLESVYKQFTRAN
jgi:hypothetical protein